MRAMGASVLVLEAVVLMLAMMPMVAVYDVDWPVALVVCIGLGVAAVLTCGLLGKPLGVVAGSVLQVAAIALGFVVPVMFVLGVVFAGLWIAAVVLGRRVNTAQAAHNSAQP